MAKKDICIELELRIGWSAAVRRREFNEPFSCWLYYKKCKPISKMKKCYQPYVVFSAFFTRHQLVVSIFMIVACFGNVSFHPHLNLIAKHTWKMFRWQNDELKCVQLWFIIILLLMMISDIVIGSLLSNWRWMFHLKIFKLVENQRAEWDFKVFCWHTLELFSTFKSSLKSFYLSQC